MSKDRLKPEHRKARLIRALSGLTQEEMSQETGIPASLIDHFEQGKVVPGGEHLERMAACAGITAADADEHLRLHRTQRETWIRRSEGAGTALDHLARRLRRHFAGAFQRLLKLRVPFCRRIWSAKFTRPSSKSHGACAKSRRRPMLVNLALQIAATSR